MGTQYSPYEADWTILIFETFDLRLVRRHAWWPAVADGDVTLIIDHRAYFSAQACCH